MDDDEPTPPYQDREAKSGLVIAIVVGLVLLLLAGGIWFAREALRSDDDGRPDTAPLTRIR